MTYVTIPDLAVVESFVVGVTPDDTFAFSFSFFDNADIKVYIDGVETLLFTVVGTAGTEGGYEGGTVTLDSPVNSVTVVIEREVERARTANFPSSGGLSVAALNKDFNRITAWVQELSRRIDNRFGFASSVTDPPSDFTENAAARASKLVGFDGTGASALLAPADLSLTTVTTLSNTLLQESTKLGWQQGLDLEPGVDIQAYDAAILKSDTAATLTAGMSHTLYEDPSGTIASPRTTGTFQLDLDNGMQQRTTIGNGTVTIAAPADFSSTVGGYMEVLIEIDTATPPTINLTGFEKYISGTMSTADNALNLLRISSIGGYDSYEIVQLEATP